MNPDLPFQYCCLCEILIDQYMRTPTLSTSDGKHGHCCEECANKYFPDWDKNNQNDE